MKGKRGFVSYPPSSLASCVSSGNNAAPVLAASAHRGLSSFPGTDPATFFIKKIKFRADLSRAAPNNNNNSNNKNKYDGIGKGCGACGQKRKANCERGNDHKEEKKW